MLNLKNTLIINSNSFIYDLIDLPKELIVDGYQKIAYIQTGHKNNIMLFNILKKYHDDISLIDNMEKIDYIKKFNIVNSQLLADLFISDRKDLFDVLIFDSLDDKDIFYEIILKLQESSRNEIKLVFLLKNNFCEFNIKGKKIHKKIDKNITYNYQDKLYMYSERFILADDIIKHLNDTSIDKYIGKIIFIKAPGRLTEDYIYSKIKDKYNTYHTEQLLAKSLLLKRLPKDKVTVFISNNQDFIPLPYHNIAYVIDGFINNIEEDQFRYPSKDDCLLLDKLVQEEAIVHRMTTENFYDLSNIYEIPKYSYKNMVRLIINIIKNNKNPYHLLGPNIKNYIQELENLNIINNDTVLIGEEWFYHLPLNFKASYLLYNLVDNKENIYPYIVLCSLISSVKYKLIDHSKKKLIDIIKEKYLAEFSQNPLLFYLNIINKFSQEIQTLTPEETVLDEWCQKNYLHYNVFYKIIKTIKDLCDSLYRKYYYEISLFDSQELLTKSLDSISNVYKDSVYYLDDIDKKLYTNKDKLVTVKQLLPSYKYPDKIISFFKHRSLRKETHDDVVFFTSLYS